MLIYFFWSWLTYLLLFRQPPRRAIFCGLKHVITKTSGTIEGSITPGTKGTTGGINANEYTRKLHYDMFDVCKQSQLFIWQILQLHSKLLFLLHHAKQIIIPCRLRVFSFSQISQISITNFNRSKVKRWDNFFLSMYLSVLFFQIFTFSVVEYNNKSCHFSL